MKRFPNRFLQDYQREVVTYGVLEGTALAGGTTAGSAFEDYPYRFSVCGSLRSAYGIGSGLSDQSVLVNLPRAEP